ncbi:calcium activated nucleotidase 1 [Aphelenchoides avenae]|nr:calcium activated nucleotidase 1 [Aphelenchus avenae]
MKRWPAFHTQPLYEIGHLMDGSTVFPLMAISDLDEQSRSEEKGTWVSPAVRGYVIRNPFTNFYSVMWEEVYNYTTHIAYEDRGLELSSLKAFDGMLLSPDDKTGIIYRLTKDQAIPWVINPDRDGNVNKSFKAEWMTIKDQELYVGGYGKEFTDESGNFENDNPLWIKIVDRFGHVRHVDWSDQFKKLRASLGIYFPAYIINESCQWSDIHQKWFFLPRRVSWMAYNRQLDPYMGSNFLIMADSCFCNFQHVRVGSVHPTRGFSDFQFLPESGDQIIVALKSEEVEGWPLSTYIMIFTIDGTVLMDETRIPGDFKLEGLEFYKWK